MRRIGVPERGHIESHGRHELCQVLRPGTTLTQKHPVVGTARHTVGVALATHDAVPLRGLGELVVGEVADLGHLGQAEVGGLATSMA